MNALISWAPWCILSLVIPFFSFSISFGQGNTGNISGTVLDSLASSPLSFASVYVKGTNIGSNTNVEGRFRLFNIPAGQQTIVCTYLGYREYEQEIIIEAGKTLNWDIRLASRDVSTDEVVITAQLQGQKLILNR